MYMGTVTPAKQPNERIKLSVTFVNNVPSGGSVSSCVVTSRNALTGTDTTSTICTGSATVSTPSVTQDVYQGTSGDTHIVTFKATMSNSEIYEDEIYLPIYAY
jgi:hypothetical protein